MKRKANRGSTKRSSESTGPKVARKPGADRRKAKPRAERSLTSIAGQSAEAGAKKQSHKNSPNPLAILPAEAKARASIRAKRATWSFFLAAALLITVLWTGSSRGKPSLAPDQLAASAVPPLLQAVLPSPAPPAQLTQPAPPTAAPSQPEVRASVSKSNRRTEHHRHRRRSRRLQKVAGLSHQDPVPCPQP